MDDSTDGRGGHCGAVVAWVEDPHTGRIIPADDVIPDALRPPPVIAPTLAMTAAALALLVVTSRDGNLLVFGGPLLLVAIFPTWLRKRRGRGRPATTRGTFGALAAVIVAAAVLVWSASGPAAIGALGILAVVVGTSIAMFRVATILDGRREAARARRLLAADLLVLVVFAAAGFVADTGLAQQARFAGARDDLDRVAATMLVRPAERHGEPPTSVGTFRVQQVTNEAIWTLEVPLEQRTAPSTVIVVVGHEYGGLCESGFIYAPGRRKGRDLGGGWRTWEQCYV